MKKEEHTHKAVCQYLKLQYPGVIFMSEPSGLRVTPGIRVLLQALRSNSALPDLFVSEPRHGFHGLYIEIKHSPDELYTKKGELRNDEHLIKQKMVLDILKKKGYHAVFGPGFDACKKIIDEYFRCKLIITPEIIEKTVCKHLEMEAESLHCKSQKREIVEARQLIMSLIYCKVKANNKEAGSFYDRDHATTTHARKSMQNLYETNKPFRLTVHRILSDLEVESVVFYEQKEV